MKNHFLWLILSLVILGVGIFSYKCFVLGFPLLRDSQVALWVVEAEIHYRLDDKAADPALNKGVQLRLNIPPIVQNNFIVEHEVYGSGGFGHYMVNTRQGHRQLVWTLSGEFSEKLKKIIDPPETTVSEPLITPFNEVLYYRAYVRPKTESITLYNLNRKEKETPLPPAPKRMNASDAASLNAAHELIRQVREKASDDESFVRGMIYKVANMNKLDADLAMLNERINPGSIDDEANDALASLLLNEAGYPARVAKGIQLQESNAETGRDMSITSWIEVWYDSQWNAFYPNAMDPNSAEYAFALWYDAPRMLVTRGAISQGVRFSVQQVGSRTVNVLNRHGETSGVRSFSDDFFYKFSMFSLPIRVQDVFRILLTIPIGALLIIMVRNFVGLPTFGTFMPVLIALAFRETSLIAGITLFLIIVSFGVAVRFYLSRFKLLMIPRLGSVLIVVLMLMLAMSMVMTKVGFMGGLSVALFPIVILTMTIERMSVIWDERGPLAALGQTVGCLIASIIVYFVVTNRAVEHLIFVFPELLFLCLATALLTGRYSGYRLFEVLRFRSLVREIEHVQNR